MRKVVTYGELERLLLEWGFALERTTPYAVFRHSGDDALIVLPRYRIQSRVTDAHLLAVRKTLNERGLVSQAAFDQSLSIAQAS